MSKTSEPSCSVTMRSGKTYVAQGTRQAVADLLWPPPSADENYRPTMRRDLLLVGGTKVTINVGFVEGVEES